MNLGVADVDGELDVALEDDSTTIEYHRAFILTGDSIADIEHILA